MTALPSDEIRSFITAVKAQVKAEYERDAALATLARVEALAFQWEQVGPGLVRQPLPESAAQLRAAMEPVA